jgi:prepilin peptidase CpaA
VIAAWFVLAAAVVAAYTDVTRRRIPNALVAIVLLGGFAIRAQAGTQAVMVSIALFAALIALGAIVYSMHIVGGGDVKFIAAAGCALGWPDASLFILFTLIAGGVLGIAVSIWRRRLTQTIDNIGVLSFALVTGARPRLTTSASGSMPYAIAIFAGAAAVVLADIFALHLRIPL